MIPDAMDVPCNGADVNVISWNHIISNLLASGGDDGTCFSSITNLYLISCLHEQFLMKNIVLFVTDFRLQ